MKKSRSYTIDLQFSQTVVHKSFKEAAWVSPLFFNRQENMEFDQDSHYSILITQVDPDALASAFALKAIIGKNASIHYLGKAGHPQNRAMINKFNLGSEMQNGYSGGKLCLVDSHSVDDSRSSTPLDDIHTIIDHHRGTAAPCAYLIQEEVGACSTLLVEMLEEIDERLATLLALGIYTDTRALTSVTERDMLAYQRVYKLCNKQQFLEIINYSLPGSHFKNLTYALNHLTRNDDGRCLVSVGYIDQETGDDISSIADYMMRLDSCSLVAVWGIVDQSYVRLSVRSTDLSTPLDQFLYKRFNGGAKLTPDGIGVGGAVIDLGIWVNESNKEDVVNMVSKRLEELILNA